MLISLVIKELDLRGNSILVPGEFEKKYLAEIF